MPKFRNICGNKATGNTLYHNFVLQHGNSKYFYIKCRIYHTMELENVMKRRRETLCLIQQELAEMALSNLAATKDFKKGGEPSRLSVQSGRYLLDVLED